MMNHNRRTGRLVAAVLAALVLTPVTALPGSAQSVPAHAATRVMPPAPVIPSAPATLEIATDGAAPVLNRDDYVPGTLTLAGQSQRLEIKGRGNSTWGWPKKPYKIKLGQEASLLGMPATKEWVLLANFGDRAALRTHLAFAVASRTRLAWTPRTRFVEVVLNGDNLGLYTLTEQVEQARTRVSLPQGGYLLEVDEKFRSGGDPGFRTRRRTPIAFKDPDELSRDERRTLKRAVNEFEDVLYGEDFTHPQRGYPAYVDVDTFVDWYLVQELFRNQDSNFYSSVYVSWHPRGRFAMGPVWDFDLSAGSRWQLTTPGPAPATEWYTRRGSHWLNRMLHDPAFVARVQSRWAELRPQVQSVVEQVPQAAAVIKDAAQRDWQRWHRSGDPAPGTVHATSFEGEVDYLHQWLTQRTQWLSRDQLYFDTTSRTLKESRTMRIPVRLWGDQSRPVRVRYSWEPTGGATIDDIARASGELVFWPGQQVGKIPLRLVDDRLPEGPESFSLVLSNPEGGAILGTPDRLQVTIAASDQQPDLTLRKGRRGRVVGADVYAKRPARQMVRGQLARGRTKVFFAKVGNDGTVPSRIQVRAPGGQRGLDVRYRSGGRDVTKALRSARGWRPTVAPGGQRALRMVVRVRPGAQVGTVRMLKLRAAWRGDGVLRDSVGARIKVRR